MAYAHTTKITVLRKGCGFNNDEYSMMDSIKFSVDKPEPTLYDIGEFLCKHDFREAFTITLADSTRIWTRSHGFIGDAKLPVSE
jgi:hypothetical protein